MKQLTFILFIALSFQACIENEPIPETDIPLVPIEFKGDLIFGDFYAFCSGEECINTFRIDSTSIYEAQISTYPIPLADYALPSDFEKVAKFNKYDRVTILLNHLPIETYMRDSEVLGQPDNHDQGGIVVSYKEGEDWTILILDNDTSQIPEELREFASKIKEAIAIMQE